MKLCQAIDIIMSLLYVTPVAAINPFTTMTQTTTAEVLEAERRKVSLELVDLYNSIVEDLPSIGLENRRKVASLVRTIKEYERQMRAGEFSSVDVHTQVSCTQTGYHGSKKA